MSGYLTNVEPDVSEDYTFRDKLSLKVPNKEILQIYEGTLKEFFDDSVKTFKTDLETAMWIGDTEKFKEIIDKILLTTISFYDYKEDFYHAFLAGIFAGAGYMTESNREHGEGRSDVIVYDSDNSRVAVFEAKYSTALENMAGDCEKALQQINDRMYAREFEEDYDEVLCYGIAFFKKRCLVRKK